MDTNPTSLNPPICPHCGGPVSRRNPKGLCRRCIARVTLPQSKEPRPADSGLHVRCPQCGHAIELGEGTGLSDIRCDSCGTRFSIVDDTTANRTAAALDRIGQFEVHEKLGAGAFGTVWKARDTRLDRWVAIKIPRQRHLEAAETEKFLREARAAAQLRHPNIVNVFEVGREEDLVYIVGDLVEGVSLAEWMAGGRVSPREAARLCRKIASALAHAHEHGVIHRDIKPGNILLDTKGEPHLTDFGLARREAGEVTMTLDGQLLGTPAYMSPELARGEAHQADARTDIYSLGVVLFQLLTGELPFRGSTRMLVHQVIHDDAPSLRKLNSHVPRDLETICLKCLEKEPARRYATAAALGEELDRFLGDEPIHARPLGPMGKTWRWCRRKPVLAGMTAAVVTLLLTVTAVSVASAWRIASARKGEQREAYYSNIALASKLIEEGSTDRALETLWKCPEQYRHWEWGHLLYLCHQEVASFPAHSANVTATVFSPDGRWVATQDSIGLAKVWDWESELEVFSFGSSSNRASWITFRPSGGQLAAILGTNGVWVWTTTNWTPNLVGTRSTVSPTSGNVMGADSIAVTETEKQSLLFTLHPPGGEITTLAYSPDGAQLVTGGSDGTVTVWDSASGQELNRLVVTNQWINRVAISPDGRRLFAAADRAAWVRELPSGQLIRTFPADSNSPIFAAFADDTVEHFATIDLEGRLTLWRKGQAPRQLITIRGGLPDPVRRVFFSPDGRWMANAGDENTARVWDLATGTERLAIGERVQWVDFSRDGNRMVTHGMENWVTTWDLVQARKLKVLRGHVTLVNEARLSWDGRLVVSAEEQGIVKVWSAGPGRELAQDRAWQHACAYSPDGRLIANCPWHEGVIIRSARSGRVLLQILPHNEGFSAIAFSPDSRRLATGGSQKSVKVWDVETGQLLLRLRGHRRQIADLAYSSDGRRIATGSRDNTAKVWDAHTGVELLTLPMDPVNGYALMGCSNMVRYVEFDARGERLITASTDGKVRIWNVATSQLEATFVVQAGFARMKAHFLPNQKHLIISAGNRIEVRDLAAGRLVAEATGRGMDYAWSFSRDGRRMFTITGEVPRSYPGFGHGTLEIWDLEGSPRRILDRVGREPFSELVLSPDDRNIACAALDYCVHRWETFPWRQEHYAMSEAPGAEREGQGAVAGLPKSAAAWAKNVRQYARGYWRERLQAELHGSEGEPAEPRVVMVPIDRALFPKRDPSAGRNQLDLTDFYTGELGEMFYGKVGSVMDHDDDLSQLPVGLVELGGVTFDVRGLIQLRRADLRGGAWEFVTLDDPVRVDGIPMQREATRLHLLLGTVRGEGTVPSEGTVIGRLELHYADGETRPLELVYGHDVRDWWEDPAKAAAEGTDRAKVVWTGSNPVANERGCRLRLYLNTRDNPRPGVKITTFDFVSAMSESGPFLIAVTLEE